MAPAGGRTAWSQTPSLSFPKMTFALDCLRKSFERDIRKYGFGMVVGVSWRIPPPGGLSSPEKVLDESSAAAVRPPPGVATTKSDTWP